MLSKLSISEQEINKKEIIYTESIENVESKIIKILAILDNEITILNNKIKKINYYIYYYNYLEKLYIFNNIYNNIINIQQKQFTEYKKINAIVKIERLKIIQKIYENKLKIIYLQKSRENENQSENENKELIDLKKEIYDLKIEKNKLENIFPELLNDLLIRHKEELIFAKYTL
jgi:hypothetical protein